MVNTISLDYVKSAFQELENFFWIKESIYEKNIVKLIKNKKIVEAIKIIALQLGLNINIKLTYVKNSDFQTTQATIAHNNKYSTITAQVLIPSNIPIYWSKELEDYIFEVQINKSILKSPISFITIISHELSHILLHSLWHSFKESEVHTDITAIVLWFKDIFIKWRKIQKTYYSPWLSIFWITINRNISTQTFWYLSDYNFKYVCTEIDTIFRNYKWEIKLLQEMENTFINKINYLQKLQQTFIQKLNYLKKYPLKKLSLLDYQKIWFFLQESYLEQVNYKLTIYWKEKSNFLNKENILSHYTKTNLNSLKNSEIYLKSKINNINTDISNIKNDIVFLNWKMNLYNKLRFILLKFIP